MVKNTKKKTKELKPKKINEPEKFEPEIPIELEEGQVVGLVGNDIPTGELQADLGAQITNISVEAPEEEKKFPSVEEIPPTPEIKKGGIAEKKAKAKVDKSQKTIYVCEKDEGELSAFATTKEIVTHLQEKHNVIIATANDLNGNTKLFPKDEAQKLIDATKKTRKEEEKDVEAAQLRIEARLGEPKELEPKQLVNPATVKDAEDVYAKAMGKLGKQAGQEEPTFFAEEMNEDQISFACEVIVANTPEMMDALASFKKTVFKYKI